MDLLDTQVYEVIGEEGFIRLVGAFYRRIPGDDILGPMYTSHDLAGAETRLREFLIMRFGGPDHYARKRGHPRLGMRHARFRVDLAARNRWIKLMEEALAETKLSEAATAMLHKFFEDAATFLLNQPG